MMTFQELVVGHIVTPFLEEPTKYYFSYKVCELLMQFDPEILNGFLFDLDRHHNAHRYQELRKMILLVLEKKGA